MTKVISSSVGASENHLTLMPSQGNGRRLLKRLPQILEQVEYIVRANASTGSYTNGSFVKALEKHFAYSMGVADAVAVNSGSSALRAAVEAFRFPTGSEIIIPSYSFISTAYDISDAWTIAHDGHLQKGIVPVFVDIDSQTYTLDPQRVENSITEKTVAICPVHMGGQIADMHFLLKVAQKHHLLVIEDAAQAHGGTYNDGERIWKAGGMGHIGCFSLSSVKNMGSMGSDAGMLTIPQQTLTQYPDIATRLRGWRDKGRMTSHRYLHDEWGVRARMDEYSAAEISAELPLLEAWNRRRQEIARRYSTVLKDSEFLPPIALPEREHVYFNFFVQCPSHESRMVLETSLRAAGVEIGHTYTIVADQALYKTGALPSRCEDIPVARGIAPLLVPIPCYPELEDEEIERIVTLLASI